MRRIVPIILVLGLAWIGCGSAATAQKKHKPKPGVTLAKSWDAAIEEAKLLNVPIVVHHHGFY